MKSNNISACTWTGLSNIVTPKHTLNPFFKRAFLGRCILQAVKIHEEHSALKHQVGLFTDNLSVPVLSFVSLHNNHTTVPPVQMSLYDCWILLANMSDCMVVVQVLY